MSEQKFTPAPWSQAHRICDEEGNYSTQVFSAETGETIATLNNCQKTCKMQKCVVSLLHQITIKTYNDDTRNDTNSN